MKRPTFLTVLFFAARATLAADVSLSIEPDPYVSSDRATICRVVARNGSPHTLDGRSIAFEAQAWENGAVVMREKGKFAGAIAAGDTAETRIGFNGVFTDVRIVPAAARGAGGTGARGGRKSAKSGSGSKAKRSASKSRSSKKGGGK